MFLCVRLVAEDSNGISPRLNEGAGCSLMVAGKLSVGVINEKLELIAGCRNAAESILSVFLWVNTIISYALPTINFVTDER